MHTQPAGTVDFVADIICPWCAIGRRRLVAALAELAAEGLHLRWVWRPFLLYPATPPGGVPQAEHLRRRFGTADAADRYHAAVAEAGHAVGLDIRYDRITCTPPTVDAHRLLGAAGPTGRQPALADALARAFFTDGADIGQRPVLQHLAEASGLDPALARAALHGDADRTGVLAADAAAKRAGITAVPAFCLHGRILPVPDPEDLAGTLRTAHRSLAGLAAAHEAVP